MDAKNYTSPSKMIYAQQENVYELKDFEVELPEPQ